MSNVAVSYCRVSTKEQSDSLPVQQRKCLDFADSKQLRHDRAFVDSQSGRTDDRPQLQALLDYCRKHRKEVKYVIVTDLSRLARNVTDQGLIIAQLTNLGIRLYSVDEASLGDDATGKLGRNVIGAISQFFSDSLSERTKYRMQEAVKEGRFVWVAPVGYINPQKGRGSVVQVDSDRAPLVRKGFELVATGRYSSDEALRSVTALGLTTRKGGPVPRQTWHSILRNPLYAGWVKSGELMIPGAHEAIVSQELFDSVQEILQENGKGPLPRRAVRPEFPLKQFVRCAKCGRGLTGGIRKKKNKQFAYLWCYTAGCRAVFVPKDELESNFVHLLAVLEPTLEYLNRLPEIAARQWEARKDGIEQEGRRLKMRLTEQKRLDSDAIKANLRGKLSDENLETLQNEIKDECRTIEDALKALEYERKSLLEAAQQTKLENVSFVQKWRDAEVQAKIELQQALFPDGLVWSHETGYLDRQNKWLIEDLLPVFQEFTQKPMSLEKFFVRFGVPGGI
jgi:site-specific DNA recombinase